MHNPFAGLRVRDTWRPGHQAVDYGMDEGDPFGAPAPGTYRRLWFEDAGNMGVLHLAGGAQIRFCHLSAHVARDGERVAEGQTLGLAGDTGVGSGPHMHTYGLHPNGTRWDWTRSAIGAAPAALDAAPFPLPTPEEIEDMALKTINVLNRGIYLAGVGIGLVHIKNVADANLIERYLNAADAGDKRETINAAEADRLAAYLRGLTP